jgi:hypothetical protein
MADNNQIELAKEATPTKTWQLDRDVLVKAVEEVSKHQLVNFKPEEYFDHKNLRKGIEEALSDVNFGGYVDAYENLQEFGKSHTEMVKTFESVNTDEELRTALSMFKNDQAYEEYKELKRKKATAILRLSTKSRGARILPIAATYAKLAKILFLKTARV